MKQATWYCPRGCSSRLVNSNVTLVLCEKCYTQMTPKHKKSIQLRQNKSKAEPEEVRCTQCNAKVNCLAIISDIKGKPKILLCHHCLRGLKSPHAENLEILEELEKENPGASIT